MENPPRIQMVRQPDYVSCGPTCLHAIYTYFNDPVALETLTEEITMLDTGGTLGVMLGTHALKRGYKVRLYTYNLVMFDPTWFKASENLTEKLEQQAAAKTDTKLQLATEHYLSFLASGGHILFDELRPGLLRRYTKAEIPMLTGLSSTYLYREKRVVSDTLAFDDVRGEPEGHFVVVSGYNKKNRKVDVADPYHDNPHGSSGQYQVNLSTLVGSIMLGCLTYDANFLVMAPPGHPLPAIKPSR